MKKYHLVMLCLGTLIFLGKKDKNKQLRVSPTTPQEYLSLSQSLEFSTWMGQPHSPSI